MPAECHELPQQRVDLGVEKQSQNQACAGPKDGADGVKKKKARQPEPECAGEGRGHMGKPGHELRDEQRQRAVALEDGLGLAHAAIGRERNLASKLEGAMTEALPGQEPRQAAKGRRHDRQGERISAVERIAG